MKFTHDHWLDDVNIGDPVGIIGFNGYLGTGMVSRLTDRRVFVKTWSNMPEESYPRTHGKTRYSRLERFTIEMAREERRRTLCMWMTLDCIGSKLATLLYSMSLSEVEEIWGKYKVKA